MVVHGRAVGQHVCVCANVDQWRPPTWASRFLHSWVCFWCCCRAALACLSRLLTSRWCSWTRLSFSVLCCCCSRVLSCSCCMRCSAIWLDKPAKRDFISQHTLRATLSSWQLVHPPIHPSSSSYSLYPFPPPRTPMCPTNLAKLGRWGKSKKSFSASSHCQRMTWCGVFTSGVLLHPPTSPANCTEWPSTSHSSLSSNLPPLPGSAIGI